MSNLYHCTYEYESRLLESDPDFTSQFTFKTSARILADSITHARSLFNWFFKGDIPDKRKIYVQFVKKIEILSE